jgi:NAD-dependent DNA ligase
MSSPSEIVGLLREASHVYYSGGNLTMDDDTYDGIVERLRELDPANPYLKEAGSPPSDSSMKEIICITAPQLDKTLEEKMAKKGLSYTRILSASVTLLVVPDVPSKDTAKLGVARELGMKVLTRAEFIQQYLS